MKILVTGSCGFIGTHLCLKLLKNGHIVVGVDNFDPYYSRNLKILNYERLKKKKNFHFYERDITNKKQIETIFNETYECVVHLAARPGVRSSFKNPKIYRHINVRGTKNILEASQKYAIGRLVFASSSSVYGNSSTPFRENQKNLKPLSVYGQTKLKGEKMVEEFYRKSQIPAAILRFFSVYGPYGRPDMAPYIFVDKLYKNEPVTIFGDGLSKRDWTYIDDIVRGIIAAINKKFMFEIINLGNSKPISLKNFIDTMEKVSGKKFIKKYNNKLACEPEVTCASTQKAGQLLGWEPKISFDEGIKRFTKWFIRERLKRTVGHL